MKEGDIILTPILQADGQAKNRPALILRKMPPFDDFLVCGISTQLHQKVQNFDDIISKNDADFSGSGLVADSLVRLAFLAVLPSAKIIGAIGSISSIRHRHLLENLSNYLINKNA
jgi:mRNA interferase MazF